MSEDKWYVAYVALEATRHKSCKSSKKCMYTMHTVISVGCPHKSFKVAHDKDRKQRKRLTHSVQVFLNNIFTAKSGHLLLFFMRTKNISE